MTEPSLEGDLQILGGRAEASFVDRWTESVNDLVARHVDRADFEVEAKAKNLASTGLAAHLAANGRLAAAA